VNEKEQKQKDMPMRQWGWLLASGYALIYDGTDPAEDFQIEYPTGLYANPN